MFEFYSEEITKDQMPFDIYKLNISSSLVMVSDYSLKERRIEGHFKDKETFLYADNRDDKRIKWLIDCCIDEVKKDIDIEEDCLVNVVDWFKARMYNLEANCIYAIDDKVFYTGKDLVDLSKDFIYDTDNKKWLINNYLTSFHLKTTLKLI